MNINDLKIVFMGTPEFASKILEALVDKGLNIVGIVTAPDKPAGRGQKLQEPEVKKYALSQKLRILQPDKLKDTEFISALESLQADIFVVVAFRMLPEVVWQMPKIGTFNLHASLLPQYRGAAPINWAIINGETVTGLTTFLIDKEIDTGKIIHKKEIEILHSDTAGDLHDRMIPIGAQLVIQTLESIAKGEISAISQDSLVNHTKVLKPAPKIYKNDCRISWNDDGISIYNKIRGLSPFPCAWTEMIKPGNEKALNLKIYEAEWIKAEHNEKSGNLKMDKNHLMVTVKDGYISLKSIQLEGKKRLKAEEFLRGFRIEDHYVY